MLFFVTFPIKKALLFFLSCLQQQQKKPIPPLTSLQMTYKGFPKQSFLLLKALNVPLGWQLWCSFCSRTLQYVLIDPLTNLQW